MRLNSMLATVLIFLCSLVISSCSNDELAPISLKNRETAYIKLNYPNNQTYSFPSVSYTHLTLPTKLEV